MIPRSQANWNIAYRVKEKKNENAAYSRAGAAARISKQGTRPRSHHLYRHMSAQLCRYRSALFRVHALNHGEGFTRLPRTNRRSVKFIALQRRAKCYYASEIGDFPRAWKNRETRMSRVRREFSTGYMFLLETRTKRRGGCVVRERRFARTPGDPDSRGRTRTDASP